MGRRKRSEPPKIFVAPITLELGRQRQALSHLLNKIRSQRSYSEAERSEVLRLRESINTIKRKMVKKGMSPERAVAAARKAASIAKKAEPTNLRASGIGIYGLGQTTKFWR